MLRPRRRLTKREIKEDKFVTYTLIVFNFVRHNTRYLLGGAVAILIIAIAVSIFFSMSRSREGRASELIADARISLVGGNKEEAIETYNSLIKNYSGTNVYAEAALELGNIYFVDGLYEEAMDVFEKLLSKAGKDDLVAYSAVNGVGASLENVEKYGEAAERYTDFVKRYGNSSFAPQALLDASRCFEIIGDYQRARRSLERLSEEYSGSIISYKAEAKLRILPPAQF